MTALMIVDLFESTKDLTLMSSSNLHPEFVTHSLTISVTERDNFTSSPNFASHESMTASIDSLLCNLL